MIRGIYTAAAGMLTQQKRQDLLTNNLANVNTPGYKQDEAIIRSFPEVLLQTIRVPVKDKQPIGSLHQGVFVEEDVPIFKQGDLTETGVNTHFAIWDPELELIPNGQRRPILLFTVQGQNGERLFTRSGLFTEDAAGQLVTPEGYLVLDDQGRPIRTNGRSFTVDQKGNIRFSDGQTLRLGLTKINNPNQLLKQGEQIYRLQGNQGNLPFVNENENYQIFQGKLERSNVDPTQTMVDMITALRIYEANQQMIQFMDKTLEKAVNEIGRV
ncbi:flagellar hook-basal body protein [Tepidibacillus fermentans]|uniref:Flagellar basal-body rod protein FlgG n=1 Tax=Tepidibacillus fermentans TaxID=1281767 RepID=A0A4R3KJN6_9BACI|nr:flagellar hook-basal body protein [Tepidibacillus fermentans]TCS83381.1 flagellar basal-body rod protein FlgG [Tepidibacillus fermentans]